jgi:phospholipid/cholesterol/gamma-HCH transport system substrate-binding protein
MRTRAQTIRLGIFVATALSLLLTLLVLVSGTALFEKRDPYTIVFSETVSGLEVGAPVKLLGVRVGRVESIRVRKADEVEVAVSLEEGTPIQANSQAQLSGSGLTGLLFVEIKGGTSDAELLRPDDRISAEGSVLGTLTGKAESIAIKTEEALNRILRVAGEPNLENIRKSLENVEVATARARDVLGSVEAIGGRLEPLVTDLDEAAQSVRDAGSELGNLGTAGTKAAANLAALTAEGGPVLAVLEQTRQTAKTVDVVLGGEHASRTAQDLRDALRSFTRTMNNLNEVINASSADVRSISASVRDAAEHMEEFARSIREDPSLIVRPTRDN